MGSQFGRTATQLSGEKFVTNKKVLVIDVDGNNTNPRTRLTHVLQIARDNVKH